MSLLNSYASLFVFELEADALRQLVEANEYIREQSSITEEYALSLDDAPSHRRLTRSPRWFGLIFLPLLSFSADGLLAIVYFLRMLVYHIMGWKELEPSQLAKARTIDLSIQFTLFWMPFLVLLGWWIDRPMHLLFGTPLSVSFTHHMLMARTQTTTNWRSSSERASWSTMSLQTQRRTGSKASSYLPSTS